MVAGDNLLDLQSLSEVGECGFSLNGLSAGIGGVAREDRGRQSTTILYEIYYATRETTIVQRLILWHLSTVYKIIQTTV